MLVLLLIASRQFAHPYFEQKMRDRFLDHRPGEPLYDEHEPGRVIVVGPRFEPQRLMQQLLHAMEYHRPRFADEIADSLNPQDAFAVITEQYGQRGFECLHR